MKLLRSIASYTRGVRMALVALAVIMSVALFMGILVVCQIRGIRFNYEVVASTTGALDRLYLFQSTGIVGFGGTPTEQIIEELEEHPALEGCYPVYTTQTATYMKGGQKETVTVMLIHPRLLELFPGMDLEFPDPAGLVIGSKLFDGVNTGDTITLLYNRGQREEVFTVTGRLNYPYQYMNFSNGGTYPTANDLFAPSNSLLMLATEENLARMSEFSSVIPVSSFILETAQDAAREDLDSLLKASSRYGTADPLPKLLENSEGEMDRQLRNLLPMPLFLLLVSTFAYFSTQVLIFKKKEQDLAVTYLCGAKRWQCMLTAMGAFGLVSLLPIALSLGLLALLPVYDWLLEIFKILDYRIDEWTYGLLASFFLLTQGITALAAWLDMKDHTPLTMLRGVEK